MLKQPKHSWAGEHKDGVVVEGCPFCRAEEAERRLATLEEAVKNVVVMLATTGLAPNRHVLEAQAKLRAALALEKKP